MTDSSAIEDRLRRAVVVAYTEHTVTVSGIVKRKTNSQRQIDMTVGKALVAFAVDYDVVPGYRTPDHLWDVLIEQAKEVGDLVRPGTAPLQHRLDYQLKQES